MIKKLSKRGRVLSELAFLIYIAVESCFIPEAQSAASAAALSIQAQNSEETRVPPASEEILLKGKKVENLTDLYVLTQENDPFFLEVYEQLSGGGFGRLLRYRGRLENEGWVDLEFVYQDRENSITILDHRVGKFFRITFKEKTKDSFCLFPLNDEKGFIQDWMAARPSLLKFILTRPALAGRVLPETRRMDSQFNALTGKEIWSEQLLRGPPAGGILS